MMDQTAVIWAVAVVTLMFLAMLVYLLYHMGDKD